MSAEYTVTRAKNAGEKDNPHGGKLVKWYVDLDGPEGEVKDCYWQRKPGSEVSVGDKIFGTVSQGDYGPRFKMEQQDGGGFKGGGGGSRNASKDAYWEAKEQRDIEGIARMGRAHAQEMALRVLAIENPSQVNKDEIRGWIDWFQQDVDAAATPAQTASAPPSQAPTDDRKGFTSDKQKRFMQSLLEKAGGSPETVGTILTYCSEAVDSAAVSKWIDSLNQDDLSVARFNAKALAEQANEWIVRDTPFPPATDDLPRVAA